MILENPKCYLVCVGSELLHGKINTHASTLARRLMSIGLNLSGEATVRDDVPVLADVLRRALSQYPVIFITGGLGPTFDDVTREAAAEATGRPLVLSKPLQGGIIRKFKRARYAMPPANARQAYLLEGAQPIANSVGTAPGQWLRLGSNPNRVLILLPGPPAELNPMLNRRVIPMLRRAFPPSPRAEAHLHFVDVPESVIDHKIRPIIRRGVLGQGISVDFTILARPGLVDLDIFVTGPSVRGTQKALGALVTHIRARVGKSFYGMNESYPLEKVIRDHFLNQRATLAVAESCTGGLLSSRLTDIPGSSDYFLGGFITYANRVKEELGVPKELLRLYGAVSRPTAMAMAEAVRDRLGSTWGLSITGIAGPSGGTRQKPVGLVYVGVASSKRSRVYRYQFKGTREVIRERTVIAALDLLRSV